MVFMSKALATSPTKEDAENKNIEENRGQMGALLLSKNEGSQSSGSIVKMSSNLFPKCEFCLLTSNLVPAGVDIRMEDYHIEFWKSVSDLSKIQTLQLPTIVEQQTQCYRPAAGLVLIPVRRPSKKASYSIFDNRRTFDTDYYDKESEESKGGNDILHCYIMGKKYTITFTGEPFTLIKKKDNQGQLQYELHHGDGSVSRTYKDIKSHFSYLCPHGGAILKGKGKDTVCIGVLNFTDEALISPVFFTKENLTDAVQLFHPSCDFKQEVSGKATCIAIPGGRTQVDASLTGMGSTTKGKEKSSEEMKQKLVDLHVEDHETRLLKNVTAHGYQIRAVHIPIDGNCLFHAVEDQLKVLGQPGRTYTSLRALAVQKLELNIVDNHLSMDLAAVVPDNDTKSYLKRMRCGGAWGGHPELVALSKALGRTIKVVTSSGSKPQDTIHSIGNFDAWPSILLGHLFEYHYKSLEQVQDKTSGQDSSVHTPGAATCYPDVLVTGRSNKSTLAQCHATNVSEHHTKISENPSTSYDEIMHSSGNDRQQLLKDDLLNTRLPLSPEDMLNEMSNLLTNDQDRSRLQEEISQLRFDLRTIGEKFNEQAELFREKSEFHRKESRQLNEIISQLRDHVRRVEKENEELRDENKELHDEKKEFRDEKKELRDGKKELRDEKKDLRDEKKELRDEKKEFRDEKKEFRDGKKELRDENKELCAVFGDDDQCSESNNVQAGEPSGSATNSSQGDSDGPSGGEQYVGALNVIALTLDQPDDD